MTEDPWTEADDAVGPPASPPAAESSPYALIIAAAEVLTHPTRFFSSLPPNASLVPAALFAVVATYAGAGAHLFWQMVLPAPAWVPSELRSTGTGAVTDFLLAGPFGLILATIFALFVHVALFVFGARREGVRGTLAVFYYASATSVWQIVPWLGILIAGAASCVVSIIGVREVHGTSTGRAAASVIAPFIVLCGLLVFGLFVLVLAGGLTSGLLSR